MKAMVLHECDSGLVPLGRCRCPGGGFTQASSRPEPVQDAICWPLEWWSVSAKAIRFPECEWLGENNQALARVSQDALVPTSKETTLHDNAGRPTTRCRAYSARSRPSVGLWGTRVNFVRGELSVDDTTLAA